MSVSQKSLFDGKVVVITGAGGGIGRAHALAFAARGASVVVNDLGGTRDGQGGGNSMADRVVEEIRALGGKAVANYDNVATVEGGKGIVQTAIDAFSGIDILVNNAGILRDKSFLKMEEAQWDAVMTVHTKALFCVTQPVAARMVEQGRGGRIINTSSLAGLLGNYGQAQYSTAKAGVYGFTRTLSMELRKAGITVNAIAPVAKTRMTEDITAVPDDMKPEQISPMVLFLASDHAQEVTGRVFGIHGQQIFEYKMKTTDGVTKEGDVAWSVEEIVSKFGQITADAPVAAAAAAAAAAPPAAAADPVAQAFAALPKGYKAGAIPNWSATFHWVVKGAGDYTLSIAGNEAKLAEGKQGTASCTVETDKDTLLGMISGTTKAEQAFMQGKIKATNLGDMMKLGQAFDFKKVAAEFSAAKAAAPVAASAAPAADPVAQAFAALPKGYKAGAIPNWSATFHWVVKGVGDYTLSIAGDAAKLTEGKQGTASCTVEVDKDTLLGMISGTTKAEQAFMQGKIKATNLGDMMKLGQAFDFKKVAAEFSATKASATAAPTVAAASAAPAADPVAQAFAALPKGFKAGAIPNWSATFHWVVKGVGDYTLSIAGDAAKLTEGKQGTASCTVEVDKDTLLGMISGTTKAEQAFMQGKIKATNLGDMMKLGQAFDFKKVAAEFSATKGAAPTAVAPEAPPSAPAVSDEERIRKLIGKRYDGGFALVKAEDMEDYAKATDDANPRYHGAGVGGGLVAPPLFPVRLFHRMVFQSVGDPDLGLDLLRLVHGEQDLTYHHPIRPGDVVNLRAELFSYEEKGSGQVVRFKVYGFVDGRSAVEALMTVFIRGKAKKEATVGEKKPEAPPVEAPRGSEVMRVSKTVTPDQPIRYAKASLDDNPIHVDEATARAAGLPGVILHGLCTMAFNSQAVVDSLLGGDPSRLRRLAVRFSKPVLPSDTVTTVGWDAGTEGGKRVVHFEATNQAGAKVITHGVAEFDA